MIVGIDGWKPEDAEHFADLGVTWTKLPLCDVDTGGHEGNGDTIREAVDAGMTVVVDLRPSKEFQLRIRELLMDASSEATDEALDTLREGVAATMDAYGHLSTRWEFWGEYDCPYVGGFWANKRAAYPVLLEAASEMIRDAQPEDEVWNGGYGVNFQPQFLEALTNEAPDAFDRANWHHYNISEYWPRLPNGEFQFGTPLQKRTAFSADKFRDMFVAARAGMQDAGCGQQFVSSEWGVPTVSDAVVDANEKVGLHSWVFHDGVWGVGDTQGAAFFDAWMAVFEQVGFEVLIYHRLHDGGPAGVDMDGTFWGNFCGLLFEDGTEKPAMMERFRYWAERGNV